MPDTQLTDAQIYAEFPELRDSHSELFKATSRIYRRAFRKDPKIKTQPEALYKAAEAARKSLRSNDAKG